MPPMLSTVMSTLVFAKWEYVLYDADTFGARDYGLAALNLCGEAGLLYLGPWRGKLLFARPVDPRGPGLGENIQ